MLEAILIVLFTSVFAAVAWWKLDWALTLCVLFLPAYLIRFEVGVLPMTILEVMILVLFLVWWIKTMVVRIKTKACPAIRPWPLMLATFVIVGIIAVLVSPDLRAAAGLWKAYVLEPVLFFVVLANVIKTREQVYQLIWALGSSAVLVGFVAMLQYLNIVDIPAHYGLESPPRATSVFPFPTAVGKYIGPILGFFIGVFAVRGITQIRPLWEFAKSNVFILGVLVFGLMGLLLSVSRGALIGVFLALGFAAFFSKKKWWIWGGMLAVVLAVMVIPATRDNVMGVFDATDTSTDVRLVMWKGAWRIIEDNPLLGTGMASFPIVYDDYKEASHTEYFPNPDHLILSVWIEMGVLGLIVFGWLIFRLARSSVQLLKEHKPYAVGLLSMLVVFLAHGMLDTPYFKNDLAVQLWVFMGIAFVLLRLANLNVKEKN